MGQIHRQLPKGISSHLAFDPYFAIVLILRSSHILVLIICIGVNLDEKEGQQLCLPPSLWLPLLKVGGGGSA